ncbi:thioredoxin family protein [Cellulophaga sp. L1A9]|uniref:thioredoxin family protein n=1 Tax=Cellulophaga sp. L1A9 TaxID=2686362 RepID=UPI00131D70B7|nr:thioredoxin family protein [Cellulophaga sp. L1A9]
MKNQLKKASKFALSALILFLAAASIESCKDKKENPPTSDHTLNEGPDGRQGPPPGDRKGPPPGDRKGPPPGGGGSPVQTETLEELGGYKIGEKASDFSLKNIDGEMVSLKDFSSAKGYIVVFTCNECPFAKMYEDRLIALNNTYAPKGYPVIAINSNNPEDHDGESYEDMQTRAKEKGFTYPYVVDTDQKILPLYGAVRTPHVYLLDKEMNVQYIGAIDDNARDAGRVKTKYVENAIAALEKGEKPNPDFTKAIGCPIKH